MYPLQLVRQTQLDRIKQPPPAKQVVGRLQRQIDRRALARETGQDQGAMRRFGGGALSRHAAFGDEPAVGPQLVGGVNTDNPQSQLEIPWH
jgi:hypothetical protein